MFSGCGVWHRGTFHGGLNKRPMEWVALRNAIVHVKHLVEFLRHTNDQEMLAITIYKLKIKVAYSQVCLIYSQLEGYF